MVVIPPVRHGGHIHQVARAQQQPLNRLLDFSASINPLGTSPSVRRAIIESIPALAHYPDSTGHAVKRAIAAKERIPEESILLGNGSAEIILALPRALESRHGLIIGPTFMEYERALKLAGAACTYVHADENEQYTPPIARACRKLVDDISLPRRSQRSRSPHKPPPIDTIFLCHPNNPTGQISPRSHIRRLAGAACDAGAWVIVDEAFIDYCSAYSLLRDIPKYRNLIVLRSFTKFYAMPGLRIGYMAAPEEVIQQTQAILPPWSVNTVAHHAAVAALLDAPYQEKSLAFMSQERPRFRAQLEQIPGVEILPSSANFFMLHLPDTCRIPWLTNTLLQQGFLIRDCQDFTGLTRPAIRLAIRRVGENTRLVPALRRLINQCQKN